MNSPPLPPELAVDRCLGGARSAKVRPASCPLTKAAELPSRHGKIGVATDAPTCVSSPKMWLNSWD